MSMKFKSDIEVQAGLRDSSGSLGASGQILSSTSGNVSWVTPTVNTVASDVQNQVKAGVAINKGQAVYVTGADGTNIIVGLASNTSEATSSKTLGLLNATVATNGFADVVQIGRLAGLNTIGAVEGDPVWLGTNGNLIYGLTNKPYAPAHLVFLGIVTRVNANNGEIFVNVQNGFELKEIHDVDIITNVPINGDVLGYDGTLWVNKTIAEWLGYAPANASGTTNYLSKFTGTTTLGNSLLFDNGTGGVSIGKTASTFGTSTRTSLELSGSADSIVSLFTGSTLNGYWFSNGTNMELVNSKAGSLILYTNNSERMRITSSGNVGIGTSSPAYKLQVAGGIYQNDTTFISYYDGAVRFGGLNSYSTIITNTGNVGIGTASPTNRLQVEDSVNSIVASFKGAGGNAYSTFNIMTLGANGNGFWRASTIGGNIKMVSNQPAINVNGFSSSAIAFGSDANQGRIGFFTTTSNTGDTLLTEAMRIDTNGNVGIGTTSPTTLLDVRGGFNVSDGTSTVRIVNSGGVGLIGTLTTHPLAIRTDNTERMRITSAGNVGIGTSSPTEKLTIAGGNISLGAGYKLQYSSTAYMTPENNVSGAEIGTPGVFTIKTGGTTERVRVATTGAVRFNSYGLGTFTGTATQKLAVDSSGNIIEIPIGAGPVDGSGTTNYVTKWTDSDTIGNSIMYDNGSRVGIGSTTPAAKLEIFGGVLGSTAYDYVPTQVLNVGNSNGEAFEMGSIRTAAGSDWTTAGFRLQEKIDSTWMAYMQFNGDGNLGGMSFGTGTSATSRQSISERMRITNTGNVGIGTTAPNRLLTVAGTTSGLIALNASSYRNTTIGSDSVGNFIVYDDTAGEYRMVINSSGNVGIGTSSPGYPLEVNGAIVSKGGGTGGLDGTIGFGSTGTSLSGNALLGEMYFKTGGSEKMRINIAGNVGIGTSNPQGKLAVDGGSIRFNYGNGAAAYYLYLNHNSSHDGGMLLTRDNSTFDWQINNLGANGDLHFYSYGIGSPALVLQRSSGNVGIGTTNPSSLLEVSGSAPVLTLNRASGSFTNTIDFKAGGNPVGSIISNSGTGEQRYSIGPAVSWGGFHTFYTDTSERMRITSSGNVGIGTSSPASKLDVNGVIKSNNDIISTNGTISSILAYSATYGAVFGSTTNHNANIYTNSLPRLTITTTGNVGIGTTSPQRRLDIVGDHTTATFRVYYPELNVPGQDASVDIWASEPGVSFNGSGIGSNVNGQPYYGRTNPALGQGFIRFINGTTAFHNSSGDAVNAERMRITPGGNLGIGTSSPFDALSINRYISFPNATDGSSNAYNNVDKSHIKIEAENNCLVLGVDNVVNSRLGWLQVGHNSPTYASATGVLALNPFGGAVGIGTSTPYSKLDVVDYTSYLSLTSSINSEATTPDQQIGGIDLRKHYGLAIGASIRQLQAGGIYNYSQSHLAFYTNDGSVAFGSVPPERMRITDTGNVGIGRTSPNNKLEVGGSIVSTGGGTFGLGGTFGFGSSQTSITGDALMAYVAINTGGSGEKMRVDINGNVGIGTTTPGAKLDVNGDALINGLTVGRGPGNSAFNTALGVAALNSNTSGEYNIAIGRSANYAVNISGSTVIGADLFTNPGNNSLASNCLAISQYNPNNAGTQYPHIYAPDKVNCPNGNTITDIIAVDYSIYTAIFMEYSIFNSDGDQFRAGTYTVAFKKTGTAVDYDNQTVVWNNTTLAATFGVDYSGSVAIIQLRNQDSDTYDVRVTARLLMR